MNGYRAILYDIDGTLLNTRDMNLYPLLRIIQEELGETWTLEQVLKYTAYAGRQVMAELGIRDPEAVYARWVRYVNEYPEPAALFPSASKIAQAETALVSPCTLIPAWFQPRSPAARQDHITSLLRNSQNPILRN